jgi:hypothetical protein
MVVSYAEFAAQQRAEHLNPFNRWCAVVAWYGLAVPGAVTAALGRPRGGATLFALSQVVIGVGHIVEGNVVQQTAISARHPIRVLRADLAVANETIMGLVRRK